MKPIQKNFIAAALLLLCAWQVSAQTPIDVTFTPATSTVASGATVAIQMKVVNFKNIATVQFPIVFNKDVLQLVSVTGAHSQLQNFHVDFADPDPNLALSPGKLAVSWNSNPSNQPNGATIPINGVFFTLNFKVLTECSSTVNLSGTQQPMIDVVNTSSQPVTVNYQNGAATITAGPCTTTPPVVEAPIQGFHIIANSLYIPAGEVGCMAVNGNDFENIVAMTYAINWDPLILELVGNRNSRTNKLSSDIQLGISNPAGRAAVLWETAAPPNTRADLSPLYELCFKTKGNPGSSTMVTPNGMGFPPTGGAEILQVINNVTNDIWRDTTGIRDTIFIQNTPPPSNAIAYVGEKDTTIQNTVGCMDVRVRNFINSTYGEFALTYDSIQLQFDHFNLGANPLGLDTSSASATNIENFLKFRRVEIVNQADEEQTLRYIQYAYRKSAGLTLPDNTVVFSACFKAVGAPSTPNTSIQVKISSYLDPGNALVPIGASRKTVGAVPIGITSGSIFIRSASSLAATSTVQNATCAASNNGSIALSVTNCSGNAATYNWTGPGITPANKTVQNPTALSPGAYNVTVTCTAGGTTTASATVTAPPAITLPAGSITNITCNGGSDGTITIAPTGGSGTLTYAWTGPNGYTSTVLSQTGLKTGIYKVTVTDANSCTAASELLTVDQPGSLGLASSGVTTTAAKCKGGSTGAITLPEATGGTSPYTYTWTGPGTFTATTKNIANLNAGSYTVVVKDSKNCAYTHNPLQITEPASAPGIVGVPAVTNVKCFNNNDGSIVINVTGGTTPYNYSWKNTASNTEVSTTKEATNLAAGIYGVTVTDAGQCTTTGTATIQGPPSALTVTSTHTDADCVTPGSIALNITGGWGSATVVWVPVLPPQASVTNVLPGTYIATVSDPQGCTVTTSVTVGSTDPITLTNVTTSNVTCHGQANGGIVIAPTGGGTGTTYDVAWTGGLSGTAISNLAGGTYTPTVTNPSSGCSAVFAPITIIDPPLIVAVATVIDQTGVTNNGIIKLTSVSGGSPTYVFSWTGPGGFTANTDSIGGLVSGDYMLTITDANLCIFTDVFHVNTNNQDPLAGTVVVSVKNACSSDGCIKLNIASTATALPFTITWSGGSPIMTQSTVTQSYTPDICGLAPGIYNITITDAQGRTKVLTPQPIAQLEIPVVGNNLNEPIDDQQNGLIILEPVPAGAPLTYNWNTGSTASALVNIDSGTYTVTVTHGISFCTAVYSYHLDRQYGVPSGAFGAIGNPTCANSATGSIAFNFTGGNGPNYQYSWSGPNGFTAITKNISNLLAGTYTLRVTDETPNVFTYDTTIVDQSHLEVTNVNETSLYTGGYQVSSANACDGIATVVFSGQSGNATIAWSNGVNTTNNTTLCRGAYSVTVTDQLGCSSIWADSLTAPAGVVPVVTVIARVTCSGRCDGIAQVTVGGGVSPYVVRWAFPNGQLQTDPLVNTSAFSIADDLCSGTYSVTVTDGNGSTTTATFTLVEPPVITATFNQNLPTRFSACDAETMITAQGATGVVDYAWSGNNSHSGNQARATGLCAGEVVVFSIVDEKGCTAVATDTIGYPEGGCLLSSPVITPGEQDGKNDELYITCAETVRNTVEIFNRWGQLVYNVTNYDNNSVVWTGTTTSGAALPEGVYFYVMTYTNDQGIQQRIKGYVNLLR